MAHKNVSSNSIVGQELGWVNSIFGQVQETGRLKLKKKKDALKQVKGG